MLVWSTLVYQHSIWTHISLNKVTMFSQCFLMKHSLSCQHGTTMLSQPCDKQLPNKAKGVDSQFFGVSFKNFSGCLTDTCDKPHEPLLNYQLPTPEAFLVLPNQWRMFMDFFQQRNTPHVSNSTDSRAFVPTTK
jgi:hypothetical protein